MQNANVALFVGDQKRLDLLRQQLETAGHVIGSVAIDKNTALQKIYGLTDTGQRPDFVVLDDNLQSTTSPTETVKVVGRAIEHTGMGTDRIIGFGRVPLAQHCEVLSGIETQGQIPPVLGYITDYRPAA